ncbi:MAG: hypothetical protein V2A73_01290 [Pseudomonadota bacterium]
MRALESESLPWYVYVGANHTRKEIYIGVCKDRGTASHPAGPRVSIGDRWASHCQGETDCINHWDCDNDDLKILCTFKADSQEKASASAHTLERDPSILAKRCAKVAACKGYSIHQTRGV